MSDRLLRITAVAGGRRSDLAVPGGVAVAELVPDLARAVGLLDPAAVYAGYRVQVHGRRLQPDRGLREQGVDDGALLVVAAGVDDRVPVVHDDPVDATAEAVARQRPWRSSDAGLVAVGAGLLALSLGLGALMWAHVSQPAAAVALTLVVLAGDALPAAAVAVGVARAAGPPVDADRVRAMVTRSARLLLAGSAAVGLLVVAMAPVVADGAVGTALAADCCVVLLLRARRHHAFAPALAGVVAGVAGLAAIVLALLVRDPDTRSASAAALVATGSIAVMAGALLRMPVARSVVRARAADLLENLALVAVAPLLLIATDGLSRLTA